MFAWSAAWTSRWPASGPTARSTASICPRSDGLVSIQIHSSLFNSRLGYAHLIHAQMIRRQHLDPDSLALRLFADDRHMAEPLRNQPAHRGRFGIVLRMKIQQLAQPPQVETAADDIAAVGIFAEIAIRLVLVVNLAHDLLHHVFHGDD